MHHIILREYKNIYIPLPLHFLVIYIGDKTLHGIPTIYFILFHFIFTYLYKVKIQLTKHCFTIGPFQNEISR